MWPTKRISDPKNSTDIDKAPDIVTDTAPMQAKHKAPSCVQALRKQIAEVRASAGEVVGIKKGPLVDTAAFRAAVCARDAKYLTNVRELANPIVVGGSAGKTQVTQVGDLVVGK